MVAETKAAETAVVQVAHLQPRFTVGVTEKVLGVALPIKANKEVMVTVNYNSPASCQNYSGPPSSYQSLQGGYSRNADHSMNYQYR